MAERNDDKSASLLVFSFASLSFLLNATKALSLDFGNIGVCGCGAAIYETAAGSGGQVCRTSSFCPSSNSSLLVASTMKTYAVDLAKKGAFREAQFYRFRVQNLAWLFWSESERFRSDHFAPKLLRSGSRTLFPTRTKVRRVRRNSFAAFARQSFRKTADLHPSMRLESKEFAIPPNAEQSAADDCLIWHLRSAGCRARRSHVAELGRDSRAQGSKSSGTVLQSEAKQKREK